MELSAVNSICVRKTGLAQFGFILAHCAADPEPIFTCQLNPEHSVWQGRIQDFYLGGAKDYTCMH